MSPFVLQLKKRHPFFMGIARLLDITCVINGRQKYNYKSDPQEEDAKAIHNDWKTVGNDIKYSISRFSYKK